MCKIIEFDDIGNYRGYLQIKKENEEFFMRVDCDLATFENDWENRWHNIPKALYSELLKYSTTVCTTTIDT